ncbi:MAG: uroporphyrinogen decarboxylase family protein [Phycisphaerae bacterium]|nr:uroporphyrinogen decarboxylase family protein [Phycisphaerae bacterium]MDD5380834.1 uroporphyrinogen decarboxylase family protein [Phycisphaerae bacterium]
MTNEQWKQLVSVIKGEVIDPLPVGFIIDSPWLPGWAGITTLDYYTNEQLWFDMNMKAIREFPDIMFLPGFWSEFGMCTEPSAFGSKCTWHEKDLPFADKIIKDIAGISNISKPDPTTDGLLPFVLHRLKHYQSKIEKEGHAIRFAVARGPLNIASFLMGTTEFLMAIRTDPNEIKTMLDMITDFIIDWLKLQIEKIPSIDGIFVLDDIVGFMGDEDFRQSALPYLKRIYQSIDVAVKFFHNDAPGLICAPYLEEIGINFFNFSFEHSLGQMKELTNNNVTLLGNIPPRDVLMAGTPEDVRNSVKTALDSVEDKSHIVMSCGGGIPQEVSTENIAAFLAAVRE